MKLSPHRLTPGIRVVGIRSLVGFSKLVSPLVHLVLYHQRRPPEAAPKSISRRTSYIRVRLAFHRYPQFIRRVFNRGRFGLPRGLTRASP